jgi:hypothetical protein
MHIVYFNHIRPLHYPLLSLSPFLLAPFQESSFYIHIIIFSLGLDSIYERKHVVFVILSQPCFT